MTPQNGAEISTEEVRLELDSVLHSPSLERCERLQKFLQCICDLTLRGEGVRINEYLIGSEVFQRGPDYSPHEDSIVRRQAHTLRRKLQQHYQKDGRGSAIQIELPLGRYVPIFRRREEIAPPAEPAPLGPITPGVPADSESLPRRWFLGALAGSSALFAAGWLTGRSGSAGQLQRLDPAVREIWGDWLSDPAGAVICFSNPLSLGITPTSGAAGSAYPQLTSDQAKYARDAFELPPGDLYIQKGLSLGKMGEALGSISLATLFATAGAPVRTTQSRFVSWQDLTRQNLIVLGNSDMNRWVDPLLEGLPFRLAATSAAKPLAILNPNPEPGEQTEYIRDPANLSQEYVLISMIPGVDGTRKLLLISGLASTATESACGFLMEGARLKELLAVLRKRSADHRGSWYFQAILRTEGHDKVPTKTALVAVRVLPFQNIRTVR
jgi:hypothetical protein